MKAGQHGPDKLYDKFEVKKKSSGKPLENEFYFVLRPETDDYAAYLALRTYAMFCSSTYPNLAREITAKLDNLAPMYQNDSTPLHNA